MQRRQDVYKRQYGEDHYLLYVTRNGVTKRTTLAEFSRINVSGKIAIDLREGDELMDVKITDGTAIIGIGSSNGKMASFYETDVRAMGRTAAGVDVYKRQHIRGNGLHHMYQSTQ